MFPQRAEHLDSGNHSISVPRIPVFPLQSKDSGARNQLPSMTNNSEMSAATGTFSSDSTGSPSTAIAQATCSVRTADCSRDGPGWYTVRTIPWLSGLLLHTQLLTGPGLSEGSPPEKRWEQSRVRPRHFLPAAARTYPGQPTSSVLLQPPLPSPGNAMPGWAVLRAVGWSSASAITKFTLLHLGLTDPDLGEARSIPHPSPWRSGIVTCIVVAQL